MEEIPKRKAGGDGKYIGLSGTDDVYFVVDRFQAGGNDPAREAYFRVFPHAGDALPERC